MLPTAVVAGPFDPTILARPEAPPVASPTRDRRGWRWPLISGAAMVITAISLWALLSGQARSGDFVFELVSDPPGAAIIIDGVATGLVTPTKIQRQGKPERLGLTREGFEPLTAAFTTLMSGQPIKMLAIPLPPGPPPPGPLPGPRVPATPSTVTVRVRSPEYPVQVRGCSPTPTELSREHRLTVRAPCTLELLNPNYIVGKSVRVSASGPTDVAAPTLIADAQLRSFDHAGCVVTIRGKNVGSPPVTVTIAVGEHPFSITCFDTRTNRFVEGTLIVTPAKPIYDLSTFLHGR